MTWHGAMIIPTPTELAAIPLFPSFSRKKLEKATKRFTIRTFPKDAIVAAGGGGLDAFHVILSGSLQWFFSAEDGHRLSSASRSSCRSSRRSRVGGPRAGGACRGRGQVVVVRAVSGR